jgi:hypothetical protein
MKSFIGTNSKVAASRCDNFTFCLVLYRTHAERGGQTDILMSLCWCVCYSFNHVYVERSHFSIPRHSLYLLSTLTAFQLYLLVPLLHFFLSPTFLLNFVYSCMFHPRRGYKRFVLLRSFIHSLILIYFVTKQETKIATPQHSERNMVVTNNVVLSIKSS